MTSGIYIIENLIDGKKYIGQGQNIEKRMVEPHRGCRALNRAIKKYGKEKFDYYILVYCERFELDYYEMVCIKILHSHISEQGYNISWGGNVPFRGLKHSEESKEKMSDAQSGENHYNFGKHLPDKTKEKISKSMLGRKGTFFGKHHSNETKERIRTTLLKYYSDKSKKRIIP